jgi:zinc and cadmium transporter
LTPESGSAAKPVPTRKTCNVIEACSEQLAETALRLQCAPMQGLPLAVGLSLVGSFAGLLIAAALLLFPAEARGKVVPWLVSYAVGTLLGSSLLHLVPEALEQVPARQGVFALLAGILTFFVLEKLVIWRHCHEGDDECATHSRAASLVIVGDAFHTFIDGAIIGAAVLTSAPLGLSTALAAATHEIPQELGDFGVLLHAGYSPRRALLLNVASGAAGIIGAVLVYTAASHLPAALPYMLAFAAGGFLYVAMADLIPGLHSHNQGRNPVRQTLLIGAGIATMLLV